MSPLQPFVERKAEEQWYKRIAMLNSNVAMKIFKLVAKEAQCLTLECLEKNLKKIF